LGQPAQADSNAGQQAASAKAGTYQTRIVQRQNLQPIAYTSKGSSQGQIRVGVRNPGVNGNDIIIRRRVQEPDLAPLTNLATLRAEVAFVQDLDSHDVLYDKNGDEVRPI